MNPALARQLAFKIRDLLDPEELGRRRSWEDVAADVASSAEDPRAHEMTSLLTSFRTEVSALWEHYIESPVFKGFVTSFQERYRGLEDEALSAAYMALREAIVKELVYRDPDAEISSYTWMRRFLPAIVYEEMAEYASVVKAPRRVRRKGGVLEDFPSEIE